MADTCNTIVSYVSTLSKKNKDLSYDLLHVYIVKETPHLILCYFHRSHQEEDADNEDANESGVHVIEGLTTTSTTVIVLGLLHRVALTLARAKRDKGRGNDLCAVGLLPLSLSKIHLGVFAPTHCEPENAPISADESSPLFCLIELSNYITEITKKVKGKLKTSNPKFNVKFKPEPSRQVFCF